MRIFVELVIFKFYCNLLKKPLYNPLVYILTAKAVVILRKAKLLLWTLISLTLISLFAFVSFAATDRDSGHDCVYYFYGRECLDCASLDTLMVSLEQEYPNLEIAKYEVYHNFENYELLQKYYDLYNVEKGQRSIPAVFAQGSYFVGRSKIESFLENWLKDNDASICPSLADKKAIGMMGKGEPYNVLDTVNFFKIGWEAIKDFWRPGTAALLLVLLALLAITKNKVIIRDKIKIKQLIIKRGAFFISGLFLAYLLFGSGLLGFLANQQAYMVFYKIVGSCAIFFALFGLKLTSKTRKWLERDDMKDLKKIMRWSIRIILSPLGLVASGIIFAALTFADLSGSFYLMRNLFIEHFARVSVFFLIFYYALISALLFVALLLLFDYVRKQLHVLVRSKEPLAENSFEHRDAIRIFYLAVRGVILALGILLLIV